MNTLQFRALLLDPGDLKEERPVQIFGTSRKEIDEWAAKVLQSAISETASVLIYQTVEQQCAIVMKPKKEAKP